MNDYLTVREAAEALGVTYPTIMGWVYRRKIDAVKRAHRWFVHASEVERIRSNRLLAA